jgi:protein phosphatase slingshot
MSLVTLQRSGESSESDFDSDQQTEDEISASAVTIADSYMSPSLGKKPQHKQHLIEKYFVVKDAALILPQLNYGSTNQIATLSSSSLQLTNITGDILVHLQQMVNMLRQQDIISVLIKLNSHVKDHIRYLAIIETLNKENVEESLIIGFDIKSNSTSVGLILPVYSNCELILDGDGGFKLQSYKSTVHIFKPISIQAMWYAYQYLHKKFEYARKHNFYSTNGLSHDWVDYYQNHLRKSENHFITEWIQNEDRNMQRDDYMTPYYYVSNESLNDSSQAVLNDIRAKIKSIMLTCKDDDYDSMNSTQIRNKLELDMNMNLSAYKKYIDATIFQFYNQLIECATCILDPFLYLGWFFGF